MARLELLAALAICLGCATANAGTSLRLRLVGYSADGRALAFERSGTEDGSGFGICEVGVIDVETNQWVGGRPIVTTSQDPRKDACRAAFGKASASFGARGIQLGNLGTEIDLGSGKSKPPGFSPAPPPRTTRVSFTAPGSRARCTLRLLQSSTGEDPTGFTHYEWELAGSCGGSERILQARGKAKELSRTLGIHIARAWINQGYLAIQLNARTPGFEGPDSTPTIVTGRLPGAGGDGGIKNELVPLGFSADGELFGYAVAGRDPELGKTIAALRVHAMANGEVELSADKESGLEPAAAIAALESEHQRELRKLGIGKDRGKQLYTSGTATQTTFRVAKHGDYELRLEMRAAGRDTFKAVTLELSHGGRSRVVYDGIGGYKYSLNSVLLQREQKGLVVIIKHSRKGEREAEHREFEVAFVPLP